MGSIPGSQSSPGEGNGNPLQHPRLENPMDRGTLLLLLSHFSHIQLLATPWIVAHQAPLSKGFPRQEYWSGLPFPSPGELLNPGVKPAPPAVGGRSFTTEPPGKPTEESGRQVCGVPKESDTTKQQQQHCLGYKTSPQALSYFFLKAYICSTAVQCKISAMISEILFFLIFIYLFGCAGS